MSRRLRFTLAGFLVVAAGASLASGIVTVAPGEVAIVRRLGRALPTPRLAGLHFGLPRGIDRVTRVRTDAVRRITIGLAGTPTWSDSPNTGEFLTGDLNIVRAQATVQYRISDPYAYALSADNVEPILVRLSEAALARSLARQAIDATLRDGRGVAARETEAEINRVARRDRLGITVLGVSLTDARPPTEVAAEFAAAQAAESDRDRRINEARTRAATTLSEARSHAPARLEHARAQADRTIALARARAGRFLALLAEADKSRPLTARRLYLDALQEILPKVRRKLVLTPDEPLDLSILGTNPPR